MNNKVLVSGIGSVSPAGLNPDDLWLNTLNERSAIQNGLGYLTNNQLQELKSSANASNKPELNLKPILATLAAMKQAMHQAGWTQLNPNDGFIFATTTGLVSTWDHSLISYLNGKINADTFFTEFDRERLSVMFDIICTELSFDGRRQLISTACAAGTHAIALAALWLKTGKVKRCLVGGTEVLSTLTVEGFRCFQLLNPQTATPFNKNRMGINLAEASAFLCLETEPSLALAEISGLGFSSDAYHMTAPHPQGKGSMLAMKQALTTAHLQPDDISWIHAHGTGSTHNDQSEALAIFNLFGEQSPLVSSTKAIHGHTLATSGLLESVLCIKALENQTLLRTYGLNEPDEQLQVNHPKRSFQTPLRHILKNTLGFGGSNGALVISRVGVNP